MNNRRLTILFSLFIVWIGTLGLPLFAYAQGEGPRPSILRLSSLEPQPVGQRVRISAQLVNEQERPNPNKVLVLYLNGEQIRRIRTDDQGRAGITINRRLPVGEHQIEVVFIGTQAYLPTSASFTLIVRPIELVIETVPPLPGIEFALGDYLFRTGEDGFARAQIMEPGNYQLEALTPPETLIGEDTQVTFARWGDSAFRPVRTVEASNQDIHVQVGFTTKHLVELSFFDLQEAPVDDARITAATLKRSDGTYQVYQDSQPQWLQAIRIVRRRSGLDVAPILYSLESVTIDGANTVNRYQQRYYVEPNATWPMQLLLYSLRVRATDALFGVPIGTGINLELPDGNIKPLTFSENDEVFQPSLARGIYQIQVTGMAGISPSAPVALSRNQDVEIKVLSALDIGLGMTLGTTIALGLLLYGRPRIIRYVIPGRRRQTIVPQPVPATVASKYRRLRVRSISQSDTD